MRKPRSIPQTDRERKKRLWLDPVIADLDTVTALITARDCHVSLRLVAQIAGLLVNLNSFIDVGYVYGSHAGLAKFVKNENGEPISTRQMQRGIEFLTIRGHLRVDRRAGTSNYMFPLYRRAESDTVSAVQPARTNDTMSRDPRHDVQGPTTSCRTNPISKPTIETCSPCSPPLRESGEIARLGEKKKREGKDVIQHRLAERLGYGDVAIGFEVLLNLPPEYLDQITAMCRAGKLGDDEVAKARTMAEVR